jgi:hypothetical protein
MSKIKSTTQNDMMSGFTVFAEEESLLMGHDVAADGWEGVETVETREKIPGSESYVDDGSTVAEVKEVKPQAPKTWEKHKAVSDFMRYLREVYPAKIPRHDGNSLSGAEAAVVWLGNLLKEISRAIRKDTAGVLDTVAIEEIRVRIMKDIILLNDHIKKLHEKFKTNLGKKAGLDDGLMKFAEEIELLYNSEESASLKKTAMIPRIQLVVQPFERAIAGIIVNSVVSGGKPLEEVYDFLKDKYKLTDREELAVMQVVMDYGYPIFKDRGTIGDSADKDSGKKHGIEFIKNYFS